MKQVAIITGASSGIGAQLARELAERGYALGLCARRVEVLETLRTEILADFPDATIEIRALDVCDYDQVPVVMDELQAALGRMDRVVVNAGIAKGETLGGGNFNANRQTIETNVIGAMATAEAVLPHLRKQGAGQIVFIASVAALRGLPGNTTAYSASKAALRTLADGLRTTLTGTKIKVTTLLPGFIDTPLNDFMPNRPFVVSVEKGAREIADLIEKEVNESAVPRWPWTVVGKMMGLVPDKTLAKSV